MVVILSLLGLAVGTAVSSSALLYTEAPQYDSGATLRGGERFPAGAVVKVLSGGASRVLAPSLEVSADAALSPDARTVLIAGKKKAGQPWQIWEIPLAGGTPRQLTSGAEDCIRPLYAAEGKFVYARRTARGFQIEIAPLAGGGALRLTHQPGNFLPNAVLRDGRVLASASSPLQESEAAGKTRLLYTLLPDGAALETLRCEHQSSVTRDDAAELEDGSVIFVRRSNAGQTSGGALAEVRKGDPGESAVGSHAAKYRSPRPLSAGSLIVSRNSASQGAAQAKFDLYTFDLKKQMDGDLIYSDAKLSSIQAVPLVANPVPKRFWSMLNMESKSGYFISLNSYVSSEGIKGRLAAAIARVRVISLQSTGARERSLGEAPVEKDGSFYVEVPANQPVRFELLDANGQTIVAERSWIWTRPGEQHGCPGCHGDKALAPENRWPLTLKRFDTPTALLEKNDAAEAAHAH